MARKEMEAACIEQRKIIMSSALLSASKSKVEPYAANYEHPVKSSEQRIKSTYACAAESKLPNTRTAYQVGSSENQALSNE